MNKKPKTKVLVAMSGGVDSSVAAALLEKAGFALRLAQGNPELSRGVEVAGAFMKCWEEKDNLGQCTTAEDAAAARRAAAAIGIPFYAFDFTREYRKQVFDYFISDYKAGRTPNPDVMCNKNIKFGLFLEKARRLGFDYIATGHYVRKGLAISGQRLGNKKRELNAKRYTLYAARDGNKDQSYFLWALTQQQLRHCLFPIGDYTKPEVRELARKFGLPNAERKDSQGICFVGKVKLDDFLRRYIKERRGNVVDTKGRVLGKHPGIYYYTIGQRRGIELAGGPFWVLGKRAKDNVLVVTNKVGDLDKRELVLERVNWISGSEPRLPLRCSARIRYQQPLQECLLTKNRAENTYIMKFKSLQRAITPGQSVVFYKSRTFPRGIQPRGKDFEIVAASPRQDRGVLRKVRDKGQELLGGGVIVC